NYAASQPEQTLKRAFGALELPAVLDAVALPQFHRIRYSLLDLLHGSTQVAARDVALDHNAALHTFAHYEIGAAILLDSRHALERHAPAGRRIEQHFTNAGQHILAFAFAANICIF